VQRKQAAWRWYLQRGVSGRSAVAASVEQRRQRGSGVTTVGSAAGSTVEGLAELLRQRGSGAATLGSAVSVSAAQGRRWQLGNGVGGGSGGGGGGQRGGRAAAAAAAAAEQWQ
jgi:hypothetical protein